MKTLALDIFTIDPAGRFSLREVAMFGFGQRHDTAFDGTMRLAFVVDGYTSQAAVAVTQSDEGRVTGTITATRGDPDPGAVAAQVARVLSLDHDSTGFDALAAVDPVLGRLLAAAPGLRPPLFYSPYEAAFWSVLSSRRNHTTANAWRRRLSEAAGEPFVVDGRQLWPLPTPTKIATMGPGGLVEATNVGTVRAERLCGVAAAALEGKLDAGTLALMGVEDARNLLRTVPGIGPFYADLILIRSTGATDILPVTEVRMLELMGELWGLGGPATAEWASARGMAWSPWQTWMAVLIRAAGPRMLGRVR